MKIGGFQPLTLSDYPGRIAAIVFTQGCNFRCPFCHNGSLLAQAEASTGLIDEAQVLDILKNRHKSLEAVVISGGEPTLQPDLATFIDRLKQDEFEVKLDTNGSQPEVLSKLLSRDLLDYVAIDIKAPFDKYNKLTGVPVSIEDIKQSIALLLNSKIPCEFRTTYVPALLTEADLEEIRSYLPKNTKYTIQSFVASNALDETLREVPNHHLRDINQPTPGPAKRPAPLIG